MSRVVVFNYSSDSLGEFKALASRGWQIAGLTRTNGGGSMALTLPKSSASRSFMNLGNMVLIEHPTLPAWAGMIDLPWTARPPAKVTVYNAEYLLTLRYPDAPTALTGSVSSIAQELISQANAQEDLYLRPGDMTQAEGKLLSFAVDQRNMWDNLNNLVSSTGMEMIFRSYRNPDDRKLYIYVDIGTQLGYYTDALLHDGDGGNMIVQNAEINGQIINRVVGTGSQSGTSNRLYTMPFSDAISANKYRTRGQVIQFRDVIEQSILDDQTKIYLEAMKRPIIKLNILIFDRDNGRTFSLLRLGNSYIVHASKLLLPSGKKAWRNIGRTLAMAYNENDNTVGMTVEGYLE